MASVGDIRLECKTRYKTKQAIPFLVRERAIALPAVVLMEQTVARADALRNQSRGYIQR